MKKRIILCLLGVSVVIVAGIYLWENASLEKRV